MFSTLVFQIFFVETYISFVGKPALFWIAAWISSTFSMQRPHDSLSEVSKRAALVHLYFLISVLNTEPISSSLHARPRKSSLWPLTIYAATSRSEFSSSANAFMNFAIFSGFSSLTIDRRWLRCEQNDMTSWPFELTGFSWIFSLRRKDLICFNECSTSVVEFVNADWVSVR